MVSRRRSNVCFRLFNRSCWRISVSRFLNSLISFGFKICIIGKIRLAWNNLGNLEKLVERFTAWSQPTFEKMENISHNNDKCIIFTDTEEVKETLAIMPGFHQLWLEFAKKTNQKDILLKKTSLEILGRPNFASVGELAFRKKQIIKQSQSTNGFIKFQTITIMPYIKQGPSLCNQIYLSKQVFVNTTKSSNLFIFTFVKIQNCFLGVVTHIYLLQWFIMLTPPFVVS